VGEISIAKGRGRAAGGPLPRRDALSVALHWQNADPNHPRALVASLHDMIRCVRIAGAPVSQ
jgi:hypothetical protein